jgi:ferredoxin
VDCIHDVGPVMVIDPGVCIDCGACEAECPVQAIYFEADVPADESVYIAVTAAYPFGLKAISALIPLPADD